MTDKLRECPFCGGESWLTKRKSDYDGTILYGGRCINTGCCEIPAIYTKAAAISKWNRRTPMDKIVEQLEEGRKLNIEMWESSNWIPDKTMYGNLAKGYEEAIAIVQGVSNDDR